MSDVKSAEADKVTDTASGETGETVGRNVTFQNQDAAKSARKYHRNMIIYYGKEVICIIALVLTTYATLQNNATRTSRPPVPRHFFSAGSLVSDSPDGRLGPTQTRVTLSELSFVLYYAPWCGNSQRAREAYDHAARLFYRDAHFAAINCWQPGGECRLQYSKVQSWPVLMAYMPGGLAVQFNGQWLPKNLVKFVRSLIQPIQRVSIPNELLKMLTGHDAVVVAFMDMEKHQKAYQMFFQTAVKFLERDPVREMQFAVVTGESAKAFGVDTVPSIRLYQWNETLEYFNSTWTVPNITSWIVDHNQQVTLWMSPPGTKSKVFAQFIKQGAGLLLFTPRNFYWDWTDGYTMMRQMGMEYYNCLGDKWINEMSREFMTYQRKDHHYNHVELKDMCEDLVRRLQRQSPFGSASQPPRHRSISVHFVNVLNSSKNVESDLLRDICHIEEDAVSKYTHPEAPSCHSRSVQSERRHCDGDFFEELSSHAQPSMNPYDKRSPEGLRSIAHRRQCELLYHGEMIQEAIFFNASQSSADLAEGFSGLACKYNKTMSFIVIDSLTYHPFAERLGVDVLAQKDKSAVFIIDPENESTYLMKEEISLKNIMQFVRNFFQRRLNRHLKTSDAPTRFTHMYSNTNHTGINFHVVSARSFVESVLESSSTDVVLFTSTNCAFCTMMSQNVLQVAQILGKISHLRFLSIDGDRNDLPWQYQMEYFPTLVVFPGHSKAESRIFPMNLPVTVQNILSFVVANLERSSRLQAIVLACRASKKIPSLEHCIDVLRVEVEDDISESLRQWRLRAHKRSSILRRLQLLRELYLHLYKTNQFCDFKQLEQSVRRIVKIWS
ncbi:thioredoxin domain-containing protein 11 [Phlebotomus argentipes]|uniref:thioredoxin domain-containing protein 11 n=1 Tax=Phlebotomus argentipes TaxID=94469 RepID=UPI0028930463|nr:thioredoxin domain-containing protein 11 [Phlebotomus argentipes]